MNLEIENAKPAIPKEAPKIKEVPDIPNPVKPPAPTPQESPKVPYETPKPRVPVPA